MSVIIRSFGFIIPLTCSKFIVLLYLWVFSRASKLFSRKNIWIPVIFSDKRLEAWNKVLEEFQDWLKINEEFFDERWVAKMSSVARDIT